MLPDDLSACAGEWRGKNLLFFQPDQPGIESEISATVLPILGGRFVRLDYTWSYEDQPKEGSLLMAFDSKTGKTSGYWIDSFHMGSSLLTLTGDGADGKYKVYGSYPAPPGPDWGWSIAVEPGDGSLRLLMWNIEPGDPEQLAVQAEMKRA